MAFSLVADFGFAVDARSTVLMKASCEPVCPCRNRNMVSHSRRCNRLRVLRYVLRTFAPVLKYVLNTVTFRKEAKGNFLVRGRKAIFIKQYTRIFNALITKFVLTS